MEKAYCSSRLRDSASPTTELPIPSTLGYNLSHWSGGTVSTGQFPFTLSERMTAVRGYVGVALILVAASVASAQEPPKPGPEHDLLKKHVGTWDTTMAAGGVEFKGKYTAKMELGGLWLIGSLESDLGGQAFSGKGLDTYDAAKKKYIGIWADSMGTTPMLMEGDYDKATKALTLVGSGPGMDGKPTTWKSVSVMPDDDTIVMKMFVGDAKEPMFTVTYKRKK